MKTTFLYLQIFSELLLVTPWEPIDYCKIKCKGPNVKEDTEHVGCSCFIYKGIDECHDDIVTFRQKILQVHNKYRNQIAQGGEKEKGYPSAANMMALGYDLELEYLARCYGGNFNNKEQEVKCQEPKGFPVTGQNFAGTSSAEILRKNAETLAVSWYEELDAVKGDKGEFISHYKRNQSETTKEGIVKFSQLVWATHRYVGCARFFNAFPKNANWTNILICQYKGAVRAEDGPNIEGKPVYKVGTPCSACPDATKCNTEYTALCGQIPPIPDDKPYQIDNRKISEEDGEPGEINPQHEIPRHRHPSVDGAQDYQYLNETKLNNRKNSKKSCTDKNTSSTLLLSVLVVIGCSI